MEAVDAREQRLERQPIAHRQVARLVNPLRLLLVDLRPPRAAERLADATGGSISHDGESGLRTVNFPAPGEADAGAAAPHLSQAPFTISRELADPAPAEAPAPTSPSGSAKPGDSPETVQDEAHKREELYEYFLDRFKRDLLAEREQMGHLIIDNP